MVVDVSSYEKDSRNILDNEYLLFFAFLFTITMISWYIINIISCTIIYKQNGTQDLTKDYSEVIQLWTKLDPRIDRDINHWIHVFGGIAISKLAGFPLAIIYPIWIASSIYLQVTYTSIDNRLSVECLENGTIPINSIVCNIYYNEFMELVDLNTADLIISIIGIIILLIIHLIIIYY